MTHQLIMKNKNNQDQYNLRLQTRKHSPTAQTTASEKRAEQTEMYRKLLNTREEQRLAGMAVQDTTPVRRPGNAAKMMNHTGNIPSASKTYQKANEEMKSQFEDARRLTGNMSTEQPDLTPGGPRKRHRHNTQFSSSMAAVSTAHRVTATPNTGGGPPPIPTGGKQRGLMGSYKTAGGAASAISMIGGPGESAHISGSFSMMERLEGKAGARKTKAGSQSHHGKNISGTANMSMKQLGRIERTSQKQLNSISKLQKKLAKAQHLLVKHTGRPAGGGSGPNDYAGASDAEPHSSPNLVLSAPKKVTIAGKTKQLLDLDPSTKLAAASRSILKQYPAAPGVATKSPLPVPDRAGISKSTLKTPFHPSEKYERFSLAPGVYPATGKKLSALSSKLPGQLVAGQLSPPPLMDGKAPGRKSRKAAKVKHASPNNSDLLLEAKDSRQSPPRLVSTQKARRQQQHYRPAPRMNATTATAMATPKGRALGDAATSPRRNTSQRRQQASSVSVPGDSIDLHIDQPSPSSGSAKELPLGSPSDARKVKKLDLNTLGGQSTIEQTTLPATGGETSRRRRAVEQYYSAQQLQFDQMEKNQGKSLLNIEQRQVVQQLIDKLDLQEAIRQKARAFFHKEQKRLAGAPKGGAGVAQPKLSTALASLRAAPALQSPRGTEEDYTLDYEEYDDRDSPARRRARDESLPMFDSADAGQLGETLQTPGSADDDSDRDLLENAYNERAVAPQSEIRRKLHKLISAPEQPIGQDPGADGAMEGQADQAPSAEAFQQTFGGQMRSAAQSLQRTPQESAKAQQDTLQLTDGQIFDKAHVGEVTPGASVGASVALTHVAPLLSPESTAINEQAFEAPRGKAVLAIPDHRRAGSPLGLAGPQLGASNYSDISASQPTIRGRASPARLGNRSPVDLTEISLLELSRRYKRAQKAAMAKSMYITREREPRVQLASFTKDYTPLVLGQYRFGLNQRAPKSDDPNAPATLRFSQMACHRFAGANARYMELYDEQILGLRKARRFLSQQINRSPEGRKRAEEVAAESPLLRQMHRKLQLQLIDETIREELEAQASQRSASQLSGAAGQQDAHDTGLHGIKEHNRVMKVRNQHLAEANSHFSSASSDTTIRRMRLQKGEAFDRLVREGSLASLVGDPGRLNAPMSCLDLFEDFVSDASSETKNRMKKATYEMDQIVTDELFASDQMKMGLSLYYDQQEGEQQRNFRTQQRQLLNYLNILFGGDAEQPDYLRMAKNLTKKLRRQGTDDSHANRRAAEIHHEETHGLDIDEENINTEIVGLLAEEILRKTEFFALYKGNVRGQKGLVQESQLARLHRRDGDKSIESLAKDPTQFFKHMDSAISPRQMSVEQPRVQEAANHAQKRKGLPPGVRLKPLESVLIDEQLGKANFLKDVLEGAQEAPHVEADLGTVEDVHREMAKASFIAQCEKNMVVTLPLLLRIHNKKLILEQYQLNNGLCQALSIALAQFPDIATSFHLDHNNLSDEDFALLLSGMSQLTYVSRLEYSHNSFGQKSLQALIPIICRGQLRHSLQSLHFKHCKMSAKVTNDLLHRFNQTRNFVRSLSLVNVNVNAVNYRELCQLIRSSRHLKELDISWNGMRCHQMYELLDVIVENRTLQDLNLAYNNLHDSMHEKFAESTAAEKIKTLAEREKVQKKLKAAKTAAQKAAAEREAMDNSMLQIMKLCRFIKLNHNLMHLNLSGMGMTQEMLHEFGRAMRRTKSLVSLHLSQNNGNTKELREYLLERAHVKQFEPIFRPDFKQVDNLEYRDAYDVGGRRPFKLENSIIFGEREDDETRAAQGKSKISEQLHLKHMLKDKRGSVNRQLGENDASEMLIFTRYLGHKAEIPGSGQWRMIATANDAQERCWVCDLECYSLVFWSREFGLKQQKELRKQGIDELVYENQLFELEARNEALGITVDYHKHRGNPQLREKGHALVGYPQIYGEFNNWKPQRMYTVEELCYIMDAQRPDVLGDLKKGNFVSEMVERVEDLGEKERALYDERIKALMTKYSRIKNWRKLLGSSLRYKTPFLANAEALLMAHEDVNIAKMAEELYPSDSESDFGSGSDSAHSSCPDTGSYRTPQPTPPGLKLTAVQLEARARRAAEAKRRPSRVQAKRRQAKARMNRQLYVVPCFLKPGKQTFVVQSLVYASDVRALERAGRGQSASVATGQGSVETDRPSAEQPPETNDMSEQYFFHQVTAPQRRERVPLFVKALRRKENEQEPFDRNRTVFKDWKCPTEKDLQAMLKHDKELWKLPRFIKDEQAREDVIAVYAANLRKLFHVFITVCAGSAFPGITWLDFSRFTETCKVLDKNLGVNQAAIDTIFIASAGDQADRYQFFEALMRMAEKMYLKSGLVATPAAALEMFLSKNCFQFGPTDEWQEFRDGVWWCYETHHILLANQTSLQKIYKAFHAPRKRHMNKADAVELMYRGTKILPDEAKAVYCYGMSKMHVILESTQKHVYDEMKYVEFLEFLGRCAHLKYLGLDLDIAEKLKMLLDELMPQYGLARKEVENEEEELSESDPDY